MTNEICITNLDFERLQLELLSSNVEQCAVLFAAESRRSDGCLRIIVREIELPASSDYLSQGQLNAELAPEFVLRVTKRAKKTQQTLIFVHTHPGQEAPVFSRIDDEGEKALRQFMALRGPDRHHAALVLSHGGLRARRLGYHTELRVVVVGAKRTVQFDPDRTEEDCSPIFDRQVRAFGADGQKLIGTLRVAIVGLGGTGSIMAQQLVHLGVQNFILIDPDVVEETNLNRIVGATKADIGQSKVSVAKRYIVNFLDTDCVRCIERDVVYQDVAETLIDADIIFCCTDSHGSRAVIQQVAYQYLIPCIDAGSTITQANGRITGIFGRVQLLSPGLPCLWCSELLDATEVRRDMMNETERRLDPYIVGGREPAPSVISLNGTVVSLAVSMLLGLAAGAPMDGRNLVYDARASKLRSVQSVADDDCYICSKQGVLAWGSDRPLFTRRD